MKNVNTEKPSWDDAPEWAEALGIANWDCDYKGEWCWMQSPHSPYFLKVERRPAKYTSNKKL